MRLSSTGRKLFYMYVCMSVYLYSALIMRTWCKWRSIVLHSLYWTWRQCYKKKLHGLPAGDGQFDKPVWRSALAIYHNDGWYYGYIRLHTIYDGTRRYSHEWTTGVRSRPDKRLFRTDAIIVSGFSTLYYKIESQYSIHLKPPETVWHCTLGRWLV